MTWYGPEGAQSLTWAHVRGTFYASSGERVPLEQIHRWPFWCTSEYEPCCRKQIAQEVGCDLPKIQLISLQSKATAVSTACVHCYNHVLLCSHSSSLPVMIFLSFVCILQGSVIFFHKTQGDAFRLGFVLPFPSSYTPFAFYLLPLFLVRLSVQQNSMRFCDHFEKRKNAKTIQLTQDLLLIYQGNTLFYILRHAPISIFLVF